MRRSCLILVFGLGCGPTTDATQSGSSEGSAETGSGTAMDATTSTSTPTTGEAACEAPAGEPVEVLIFKDGPIVVGPGSLTCGDAGSVLACDCIAETIHRLVLTAPPAVGAYAFTGVEGAELVACDMGDDGCSQISQAGTLTIVRADADCVAGTVDFGNAGTGSFAAAPCA